MSLIVPSALTKTAYGIALEVEVAAGDGQVGVVGHREGHPAAL